MKNRRRYNFPGLLFTPAVFEEAATYEQQIRWLKSKIDDLEVRVKKLEDEEDSP